MAPPAGWGGDASKRETEARTGRWGWQGKSSNSACDPWVSWAPTTAPLGKSSDRYWSFLDLARYLRRN
eukprot:7250585-Pyramimonas_sp.AAC.1